MPLTTTSAKGLGSPARLMTFPRGLCAQRSMVTKCIIISGPGLSHSLLRGLINPGLEYGIYFLFDALNDICPRFHCITIHWQCARMALLNIDSLQMPSRDSIIRNEMQRFYHTPTVTSKSILPWQTAGKNHYANQRDEILACPSGY
jgi:hypothetical protein